MTPSPQTKPVSMASILVFALVILLVVSAILVRLVDGTEVPVSAGERATTSDVNVNETQAADVSAGLPVAGNTAPDFSLEDPDGHLVKLSDWRGKPVLVNFWATWCGPCQVEMPIIEEAYQAHQDDELIVLAVAVDDSVEDVRRFFDERDLSIKAVLDDGTASRLYHVFGLPTSFFIGPDGKIVAVHTGLLTEGKIEEYLTTAQIIQEN